MTFTVVGWLVGWLLLDLAGIQFSYSRLDIASSWLSLIAWAVLAMLVLASAYVYFAERRRWRVWSGIMLVGMLAGAVFLWQPA